MKKFYTLIFIALLGLSFTMIRSNAGSLPTNLAGQLNTITAEKNINMNVPRYTQQLGIEITLREMLDESKSDDTSFLINFNYNYIELTIPQVFGFSGKISWIGLYTYDGMEDFIYIHIMDIDFNTIQFVQIEKNSEYDNLEIFIRSQYDNVQYQEGYIKGYDDATLDGYPDAYQDGYNAGTQVDNNASYQEGFKAGSKDGFESNIHVWIVPAILVVIVLGGIVSFVASRRRD